MAELTVPTGLIRRARDWIDADPDPADRLELEALIELALAGDDAALPDLTDRFASPLAFGTAGLRGTMAAGPNRMNRAVVIRASYGLATYLRQHHRRPTVVLGNDARHRSAVFADDTARVLAAAGVRVRRVPENLPTPVLAYAVRDLEADGGVMITASHNPAADNGYKVYLADGAQLAPPADAAIAAAIAAAPPAAEVPRTPQVPIEDLGPSALAAYLQRAVGLLDPFGPRELRAVHTALHGVAAETFRRAWQAAGFRNLIEVEEQSQPDPTFPTVAFPNPEEPGALDLAIARATAAGADLVLAHDPDGDRCAVAVPTLTGWRRLTGDEVGLLLAEHQLRMFRIPDDGVLATTVVSGPALDALAALYGRRCVRTLTGFKWLARVPNVAYAYEEALGYCTDPDAVRDKDGITAALLVAEMAALSRQYGLRLTDRLDALAQRIGVHATAARSIRLAGPAAPSLTQLRAASPTLDGRPLTVADLTANGQRADGVILTTDQVKAIVRPSGTEPKVKVYLHASVPPPLTDVSAVRTALAERLERIGDELVARLAPRRGA